MEKVSESVPHPRARHSIAVVARRTGLSQLVLRAWERRYGAIVPERTDTGRRRYSDQDIQKLTLLKFLTDNGHRIGDIARMNLDELENLFKELGGDTETLTPNGLADPNQLLLDALQAVEELHTQGLEDVLNKALVDLSKPDLRNKLLVPLMLEIGNRWHDGRLRVTHEHMGTSIVVTFLSSINSRYRVSPGAPALVVATPAGQQHELGALLAASVAYESGWNVVYLGADLPAEDIAAAAKVRNARAVLISLIFPQADAHTIAELKELRRLVGPGTPIFAGGQAVPSYTIALSEIGAMAFTSIDALEEALRQL